MGLVSLLPLRSRKALWCVHAPGATLRRSQTKRYRTPQRAAAPDAPASRSKERFSEQSCGEVVPARDVFVEFRPNLGQRDAFAYQWMETNQSSLIARTGIRTNDWWT